MQIIYFKKNLGKERGKISILNLKGVNGSTKRFIDFCKKKINKQFPTRTTFDASLF